MTLVSVGTGLKKFILSLKIHIASWRPNKNQLRNSIFQPQCFRCFRSLSPTPPTVRTTRRLEELHHVGMVKPKVPNPVIEWSREGQVGEKNHGVTWWNGAKPNKKLWLKWWVPTRKHLLKKKMIMAEFGWMSFNKKLEVTLKLVGNPIGNPIWMDSSSWFYMLRTLRTDQVIPSPGSKPPEKDRGFAICSPVPPEKPSQEPGGWHQRFKLVKLMFNPPWK